MFMVVASLLPKYAICQIYLKLFNYFNLAANLLTADQYTVCTSETVLIHSQSNIVHWNKSNALMFTVFSIRVFIHFILLVSITVIYIRTWKLLYLQVSIHLRYLEMHIKIGYAKLSYICMLFAVKYRNFWCR